MERKIMCNILTPERVLYEGEMNLAVVQIHDGEIGFLSDHTPLVAILGTGEIRLRDRQTTEYFFVDGGLVEIRDNKMVVLAEKALKKSELVKEDIEKGIQTVNNEIDNLEPYSGKRMTLMLSKQNLKAQLKVSMR